MKKWENLKIFELAIENASDHIIITDPEGLILYANPAVSKITGYKPKELTGKKPSIWGRQMPEEFYRKFWKRLKADKKPFIGEIRNKRKNGEHYDAEIKVAPVLERSNKIKYFVGIERDITRLKQIDQVKTEIISLTAHQLRDAPATIKIYAESLLEGIAGRLTKKQTDYVKEILTANQANIDLIKALLNVARLELGTFQNQPELLDLKKASKTIIKSMEYWIKKGQIKISECYDKDLRPVMIDPESFRIIMQNLLSNACKYSPKSGQIHINIALKKRKIHLTVSDTGYGIPREEQSRIFTKMFRAGNIKNKKTGGYGLGLYMVKLTLNHLKGSIRFRSAEGKGTSFFVSFPIRINSRTKNKKFPII